MRRLSLAEQAEILRSVAIPLSSRPLRRYGACFFDSDERLRREGLGRLAAYAGGMREAFEANVIRLKGGILALVAFQVKAGAEAVRG